MRAILDIILIVLNLYTLGRHPRRHPVLADRVRRRQHTQRSRSLRLEPVPRAHRAVPAPDPQFPAQHRRHRPCRRSSSCSESCSSSGSSSITSIPTCSELHDRLFRNQDRRRPVLRGLPHRRHDPPRDAAHACATATPRSIRRSMARASRPRARTLSPKRSATPRARSTTCSPFTSCSARPFRTSRSTRSPISATPTAAS